MRARQVLALVGSGVLALGVFVPIISVPISGSINYFMNGRGDGTFILILAAVSLVLTLQHKYEWLLTTGVVSLAQLLVTFVRLQNGLSAMTAELNSKLAGNPFRGLVDVAAGSVQLQWGWMVLVIGSALLVAAAVKRGEASGNLRKCPFCAELIRPDARVCKHCKSDVSATAREDTQTVESAFPRRVLVVTALAAIVPLVLWAAMPVITHCDWRALACEW